MQLAAALAIADQFPIDVETAGVDLLKMVDASQERRLARAGWTDHAQHFAPADVQRHALEDVKGAEVLAHTLGPNHRFGDDGQFVTPIWALAKASSCLEVSLRDAPREKCRSR